MINYILHTINYLIVWFKTKKPNGVNECQTSDHDELFKALNNSVHGSGKL